VSHGRPLTALVVYEPTPFTRSEQRMRALCELGLDVYPVSLVPRQGGPAVQPERRLLDRIAHRLGRPVDRAAANAQMLAWAEHERPDVIWIEGGRVIRPATLERLARIVPDAPRILFTEDDLALSHNRSHYQTLGLAHYDLVVTTKRRNVEASELEALGARAVHYEPKSFDPWFHRPLYLQPGDRERLGGQVGFVGTFEADRAHSCLALAEAGYEVRVFGNGWDAWSGRHPKLRIEGRPIGGEDYVRAICATDINLGFLRRRNRDQHTDRSVEIPACGAFLLAERSTEHRELLAEGREAAFFSEDDELIALTTRWLAEPERRRAVARAGRLRCVQSGYDHPTTCLRVLERAFEASEREAPHAEEAA
jgi:hypothetical protein